MEKVRRKHDKSIERSEIDRISNLPWDVLDTILVNLSLKDAARTSILSKKWRYKWTSLSQYIVDDKCIPSSVMDKAARWVEIKKIIDQVRSNHSGPIEKFKLTAYCRPDYSDLNQWITFLTEKGIKELSIQEFSLIAHFKLPPCIFSCPKLTCLELYGCVLRLPSSFRGFDCLKTLQLSQVSITSDTLELLVSNCYVLERLTLLNIDHLSFVKIHNPNLKYVKIDSKFGDICLGNGPHLASVDIRMIPIHDGRAIHQPPEEKESNLVRVLGSFHGTKRLSLSNQFLEFLVNVFVPPRLPLLASLLSLSLREIRFTHIKDIVASIFIIRSAPNLSDLHVTVETSDEVYDPVMELMTQCYCGIYFSHLKVINIRGIFGTEIEWEFIKFLLCHSPVLESMTIVKYIGDRIPEWQLLGVDRASNHVKFTSLSL
ncbi:hypothetical protein Tsubulata_021645 [Turnera subulata]|uniref:F-box domain-containing protein n=1 Tax=Turnera subulata TaxID=218843 RepID=A0A9Q0JMM8_9ROSI|nr:hypothetical protein Tsubulata_021645 [Turnera subulata]